MYPYQKKIIILPLLPRKIGDTDHPSYLKTSYKAVLYHSRKSLKAIVCLISQGSRFQGGKKGAEHTV